MVHRTSKIMIIIKYKLLMSALFVVMFIMKCKVVLTFQFVMKSLSVTIQVKDIEQYFPVALFIMPFKVVLTL